MRGVAAEQRQRSNEDTEAQFDLGESETKDETLTQSHNDVVFCHRSVLFSFYELRYFVQYIPPVRFKFVLSASERSWCNYRFAQAFRLPEEDQRNGPDQR